MVPIDGLIATLADGAFHSGVELGRQLGVSRTAVWKNLQKLSSFGIAVEKVKGLGYRVPGGFDLLKKDVLVSLLRPDVRGDLSQLDVLTMTDSTNAWMLSCLKERAQLNGALVCAAEYQSAGRGRRGRGWVSTFGQNVCLSVGYTFREGFGALEGLSLAVGVMVADALAGYDVHQLGLKWPNDIWVGGRKIGGILIELSGEQGGPCQVVIGLGVNVHMSKETVDSIDQDWTSLAFESSYAISRNEVVARLINSVVDGLRQFERQGFAVFKDRWQQLDALKDRPVTLQAAQSRHGISRGIGRFGHLLLETENGIEEIGAGDVSLRSNE